MVIMVNLEVIALPDSAGDVFWDVFLVLFIDMCWLIALVPFFLAINGMKQKEMAKIQSTVYDLGKNTANLPKWEL